MVEIQAFLFLIFPLVHTGRFSCETRKELLNEDRERIRWIQTIAGSLLPWCRAVKRYLEVRCEIVQIHHEHCLQGHFRRRGMQTGCLIVGTEILRGVASNSDCLCRKLGRNIAEEEPAEEPLPFPRV